MTMIDDLVKDEEFSSDEEQAVASAIHARNGNIENLEYLKKDREGFTEFSYEMGINYLNSKEMVERQLHVHGSSMF